ncbi:MAG: hypothetical protein WCJ30_25790 [Deltaproteobacteria bacterium]
MTREDESGATSRGALPGVAVGGGALACVAIRAGLAGVGAGEECSHDASSAPAKASARVGPDGPLKRIAERNV